MSLMNIPNEIVVKLNNVKSNEDKQLLFFLPGLEGNCELFRDLAERFESDQVQVYGLQFNFSVPMETVTSMARFYLKIIEDRLKAESGRDFSLAGYSFGGLIAIEIARIMLEEEDFKQKNMNLLQIFLFESSHDFFKVGAHQNFQTFKHEINNEDIMKHTYVYTAVLSIYLVNLIGANKYKFKLYDYIRNSRNLDDALDKSMDFIKQNSIYDFDSDDERKQMKNFLKLLLIKSAAGYLYYYNSNRKLDIPVYLLRTKNFIYSINDYDKLKNSIKFNTHNYNLNNICGQLHVYVFENGNHWTFIGESIDDIHLIVKYKLNQLKSKL